MPVSEASTMILVGAFGYGWQRKAASTSASLIELKAAVASAFHVTALVLILEDVSSELSGCRTWAHLGTKRRYKLTRPQNSEWLVLSLPVGGCHGGRSGTPRTHLLRLMTMLWLLKRSQTRRKCCWCSSALALATKTSCSWRSWEYRQVPQGSGDKHGQGRVSRKW